MTVYPVGAEWLSYGSKVAAYDTSHALRVSRRSFIVEGNSLKLESPGFPWSLMGTEDDLRDVLANFLPRML